jgi:hypothetical protein
LEAGLDRAESGLAARGVESTLPTACALSAFEDDESGFVSVCACDGGFAAGAEAAPETGTDARMAGASGGMWVLMDERAIWLVLLGSKCAQMTSRSAGESGDFPSLRQRSSSPVERKPSKSVSYFFTKFCSRVVFPRLDFMCSVHA